MIMANTIRFLTLAFTLTGLAACEPGFTGTGGTRPGISGEALNPQAAARRTARKKYYRGSRSGMSDN